MRQVSHNVETVLDLARNAKLSITSHVIDVVLESADYLKICVNGIESKLHGDAFSPAPDPAACSIASGRSWTSGAGADPQVSGVPAKPAPRGISGPARAP